MGPVAVLLLVSAGTTENGGMTQDGGRSKDSGSLVRIETVTFLLPEATMGARITPKPLADYLRRLQAAAAVVAGEQAPVRTHSTTLAVTIAVKPAGDCRIWVDAETPSALPAELRSRFEAHLRPVETPRPTGLIVLQMRLQVWGGEAPKSLAPWQVPDAWKHSSEGSSAADMSVELFVEKTWDRQL